jgi:hypothetical protein
MNRRGLVRTRVVRLHVFTAAVLSLAACDSSMGDNDERHRGVRTESDQPPKTVMWGCQHTIAGKVTELDPQWREDSIVVGDFGFNVNNFKHHAWQPHEKADLQFKLPVIIEGHSSATVWIPDGERERVALILSNVPRRGPKNSYRVEDGHQAVSFNPCADKEWSAWVAGLALADRRESVLKVKADDAPRSTRIILGPWSCRPQADCVLPSSKHSGD